MREVLGVNITRMEFKDGSFFFGSGFLKCVNITRMEFKGQSLINTTCVLSSVNITRMEFKVYSYGDINVSLECKYNQNGIRKTFWQYYTVISD